MVSFSVCFLPALLLCARAAAASPPAGRVLWSKNISGESYWYGAVADGQVYAGTFGLSACWLDVLDLASGAELAHVAGVCRVDAYGGDYGAAGPRNNGVDVVYNVSGGSAHHIRLGGGYYPALGNSVVVRRSEMFVWGEEHFEATQLPKRACMYRFARDSGKTTRGPCILDFGNAETAEIMAVSDDGSVVLLSAGLKVIVAERQASDWSTWTVRFNATESGFVVGQGVLSGDAALMAISYRDGARTYRYDAQTRGYTLKHTLPPADNLQAGLLALQAETGMLVATFNDDSASRQWAVQAYNLTSGAVLWTYLSAVSSGEYTDTTASVSISRDGSLVAVGSWGDHEGLNPQLHVFRGVGGDGKPLLAHRCPGSITTVHVASDAASAPVVVALGLQQHENVGVNKGLALAVTF